MEQKTCQNLREIDWSNVADKIELTPEEKKELSEGQSLYEMTKSSGFAVLEGWLKNVAFHSWVDPREVESKEEWEWRELNAFHAANNARELLDEIQKSISRAEYLEKKRLGEIKVNKMKI